MVFLETPSHRDTGQPLDTVGHLTAIMSHSRLLSLYPGSVLDLLPAPQEAREEHAEQVEGTGGTKELWCFQKTSQDTQTLRFTEKRVSLDCTPRKRC